MTWIEWCRVGAAVLVLLSALRFCILYNKKTGGTWRNSVFGVHMMVFSGAFVVYFGYAILSLLVLPESWRPYSGTVLFLSLAWLFAWRTRILNHAQREKVDDASSRG